MTTRRFPLALLLLALVGGVAGFAVALAGSLVLGIVTGLLVLGIGVFAIAVATRGPGDPHDPSRRRFLLGAGGAGLAWAIVGPSLGWLARSVSRPDPRPVQEAMASDLGAEYMELVKRAYHGGRSGDLQLLLAPFNSSNYTFESLTLVPQDPRTSHASTWMYLQRVPLVVHGPGLVLPSDSDERVTLADLAPTTANLIGANWPDDRRGQHLPLRTSMLARPKPKVVMTFVIDGGGWNVLDTFPDQWPNLKRLMGEGANFRNAIVGSFPAVTACAHATIGTGTFPSQHGITGHNIRDGAFPRKAYGTPGQAQPGDILVPTLADLWSDQTGNRAWVGEIGYQVWHMGMLGYGGRNRPAGAKPVGVYWAEDGSQQWEPHNPDLFRLPASVPGLDVLAGYDDAFVAPDWDAQFAPTPGSRQSPCCSPPIVRYQGDLLEATFDSEPIGEGDATSLLYTTFKSPDYTGHVYGMFSDWTGLQLEAVDAEIGRMVELLDARFPNEYVLIVTADHGQCPLPDAVGGVRLDPIQLREHIEAEFAGGINGALVQDVVPHEIYLDTKRLWDDGGATVEDIAAFLRDYRYRQNIGPYVPRSAIEQDLLDEREFAGVFATTYMATLAGLDTSTFGETAYPDGDYPMPGPIT
jgi:Type I phosphodiesterase / nucleotide pyrophosphatase